MTIPIELIIQFATQHLSDGYNLIISNLEHAGSKVWGKNGNLSTSEASPILFLDACRLGDTRAEAHLIGELQASAATSTTSKPGKPVRRKTHISLDFPASALQGSHVAAADYKLNTRGIG